MVNDCFDAPQLMLTLGTSDQHSAAIKEGSDVYFDCNVKSNPEPEEVSWYVGGAPLATNASRGVLVQRQSLILQKVGREDRGMYHCQAVNSEGEGRSDAVRLDVQYSPVCRSPVPGFYSVVQGESVNITCDVESDPAPAAFQWTLNNTLQGTVDLRRRHHPMEGNLLHYVPRYLGDYGTILCWGRNDAGVQRRPCVWHVTPEGEVSTDMGVLAPSTDEEEEGWRGEENWFLSPALGVVVGVVLALFVLVLVVIVVIKIQSPPPTRRTYFDEEKLKYPSPIKKEPTDSIGEGNEKSPDIIPLPSDIEVYATTVAVELCPTSPMLPKQSVEAYYTVENQTCV